MTPVDSATSVVPLNELNACIEHVESVLPMVMPP